MGAFLSSLLALPPAKPVLLVVGLIALVHLLSLLFVDSKLEYRRVPYSSPRVPEALNGYTVAFLTDIHHYSLGKLAAMADAIRAEGVDLVLFGGDFLPRTNLPAVFRTLAAIRPADGFYGVVGNHDRPAALRKAMDASGMVLLENESAAIRDGLVVAGLEDLERQRPDLERALKGVSPDAFRLVVAHNPDTSMKRDCAAADLMLSGHTHGGEVTFFGLWAPAMPFVSRYGQRFVSGWCRGGGNLDVYVSRGIGAHLFRVFARPQVIYLTLENEQR